MKACQFVATSSHVCTHRDARPELSYRIVQRADVAGTWSSEDGGRLKKQFVTKGNPRDPRNRFRLHDLLVAAQEKYMDAKNLDEALFGKDYEFLPERTSQLVATYGQTQVE